AAHTRMSPRISAAPPPPPTASLAYAVWDGYRSRLTVRHTPRECRLDLSSSGKNPDQSSLPYSPLNRAAAQAAAAMAFSTPALSPASIHRTPSGQYGSVPLTLSLVLPQTRRLAAS